MFSARKKERGGKKEQPHWKRHLEGHSDDEAPSKRGASTSAEEAIIDSSSADPKETRTSSKQGLASTPPRESISVVKENEHVVEDDDDDNFDPSNYDLGSGDNSDEEEKPPWASSSHTAHLMPPGALPAKPVEYSGGPLKGARYVDVDGRDTICFHSKGASNEACQTLVGSLPGYRATRFVRELVFVLFSDHAYATAAMETLNKASLLDEQGKKSQIRTEWAKRSLRPY